jgi:hypothetical protein
MQLERINTSASPTNTVVYFVRRADGAGPVKIGCTSDLLRRLEMLSSRRQEALPLLASAPATFSDEKRLHQMLASDQVYGEWFTLSDAVAAVIAEVNATGTLPAATKCAARTARSAPSMARMMGLDTAAMMLGGRHILAEALGLAPRTVRAKLSAERGVSDDDLRSAADALDARAASLTQHAQKLRDEAAS